MEEAILFERSLDDVKGMISHAKLIESNLLPLSQIVRQEQMSQQVVSIEVLQYTELIVVFHYLPKHNEVHYCDIFWLVSRPTWLVMS